MYETFGVLHILPCTLRGCDGEYPQRQAGLSSSPHGVRTLHHSAGIV